MLNISLFARDINIGKIVNKSMGLNKHLLVFLHKTNCGYCERMIDFTLDDEGVKELIKQKFVFIDINIKDNDIVTYKDFKGTGHDFAKYMEYDFYPTSLFFDKNNDLIYVAAGYREEKEFLDILRYISSYSYKKKIAN